MQYLFTSTSQKRRHLYIYITAAGYVFPPPSIYCHIHFFSSCLPYYSFFNDFAFYAFGTSG